ncbi:uncharacterized protein LOC115456422 isoform X2 [Manduca sexta]|uniref:Insulin-like domain-containing protein n=1 Tax=Manduca sexta TaxID=7130 RepID=A0A922CFT4_MANSE|nr:uncharacterized protein LOC115456422 isoform X2 [Manduca sexta]KAG6444214.1 hypothetical protein O3G_MSEX003237 [Manduca sexta]
MNLGHVLYILIILFGNNWFNVVHGDRVYNINDKVLSCSGWLSTIIYNFCNNHYKIVKRDTSLMIEKMAPKDLQKKTIKHSLLEADRWRRMRRQVANECCLRACTVADIIMYCPNDAKLLQENPDIFD